MPCAALSSQVEGIAAQIGSGSSLLALSSHVEGVETSSWGIRRVGALSSHVEGVPPHTLPIAAGIGGQGTSGRYLLGLLFSAGSAVPRPDLSPPHSTPTRCRGPIVIRLTPSPPWTDA